MTSQVCSTCSKFDCELRVTPDGRASCSICRALDRIRGVCLRLPSESSLNIASVLYDTEARLRDLRHFGGTLPVGTPVRLEPPAGESLSQILTVGPDTKVLEVQAKASSSGSSPRDKRAPVSTAVPASASRVPVEPPGPPPGTSSRKRRKKNKGSRRLDWQDLRCGIKRGRDADLGGELFDWSGSSSDIE